MRLSTYAFQARSEALREKLFSLWRQAESCSELDREFDREWRSFALYHIISFQLLNWTWIWRKTKRDVLSVQEHLTGFIKSTKYFSYFLLQSYLFASIITYLQSLFVCVCVSVFVFVCVYLCVLVTPFISYLIQNLMFLPFIKPRLWV